ncbi:MAG: PTS sugar transporter subunit IIC [Clostridia bacterium]|nr:PTS sugar transporter subunit IIC [Clostridia bacterium]
MENTKKTSFRAFLDKKGVTLNPKLYFVDAMSSMAMGLFATLLMGTIFGTIAGYIPAGNVFNEFFVNLKTYAQGATGIVLGIAVAYALKAPPLVLFSAGVVGMCGNALGTTVLFEGAEKAVTAGPLGAFICVLIAVEIGKLVSKATKVDILVTPAVTIGTGVLVAMLICPGVAYLMYWLGYFINFATNLYPLFMGIIISVVVGIVLTLPISSAALCAMIGISGLAGGAAVAGCCAQMVGFAVISFRENKWAGVVAQGLGTSMFQMGNIVKNPLIWIPATLASAITGPISTCLFKLECTGVSAGMGTCGLVGPIGVFADMGFTAQSIFGVITVCIVLPAILSLLFSEVMRRLGWIRENDMKLDL